MPLHLDSQRLGRPPGRATITGLVGYLVGYHTFMLNLRHPESCANRTGSLPSPTCTTGPVRLELTLTPSGDRCTVTMIGTLDEWSTPAVDTQYDQLIGAGYHEVVLDVSGIRQVDESGAVALSHLWARLRNCGVFCRIRGLAPRFADNPIELLLFLRRPGSHAVDGQLGAASGRAC